MYDSAPAAPGQVVYGVVPTRQEPEPVRNEGQPVYAVMMKRDKTDAGSTGADGGVTGKSVSEPPVANAVYAVIDPKKKTAARAPLKEPSAPASASHAHAAVVPPGPSPTQPLQAIDLYDIPMGVTSELSKERGYVNAWLQAPIDRAQAQSCLHQSGLEDGAYLVRKSSGDTYGLSIVSHKAIYHMKIMSEQTKPGKIEYYIQGDKEFGSSFESVWELLNHYKQPTDRLTWHLVQCISDTFIPK
eukprot:m.67568 g.67568  ORF g.67568 m.67568 type:complete len:243 (+) comp8449_c1_seq1:1866-2594(+)